MIKSENPPGGFSSTRVRAPSVDSRSTPWLPLRQMAMQNLVFAAQELILDKYWMCFPDPGRKPVEWSLELLQNAHVLQNHHLELMTKEFALLGHIPVRRTPDSMSLAYVRLLHELLHKAERTGSKDDDLLEGATQYMAIHAYLGEVPDYWMSHPRLDFGRETGEVADRINTRKDFSVIALARAYFGNGEFNALFRDGESNSQKK
jgi:hypothetical protein